MRWQRFRTFVRRRFVPGQYLGLHLTVGLFLSLTLLVLFFSITRSVRREQGALTQFDLRLARGLEEHAGQHPGVLEFCRFITDLGGIAAMVVATLVGSSLLLINQRHLVAAVWISAALGGGLITLIVKEKVARARPANPDAMVREKNESYFSGHSMGSVVAYGMLAYVLFLGVRRRWLYALVLAALTVLVVLIGFSRLYLRAHFFTDVVGGYCIGAFWLAVCISGLEVVRRRRLNSQARSHAPILSSAPAADSQGKRTLGHPALDNFAVSPEKLPPTS
jgi:undecaprenyl-diphosphatase